MRSPRWRESLQQVGREIVREHGLHSRRASTAEQTAALTLLGHWGSGTLGPPERRIGIIGELVGGPERFDLADLERRHETFLDQVVLLREPAAAWLRDGQVAPAVGTGVPAPTIVVIWLVASAALAWPIWRAWSAVERTHNELALERVLAGEG